MLWVQSGVQVPIPTFSALPVQGGGFLSCGKAAGAFYAFSGRSSRPRVIRTGATPSADRSRDSQSCYVPNEVFHAEVQVRVGDL